MENVSNKLFNYKGYLVLCTIFSIFIFIFLSKTPKSVFSLTPFLKKITARRKRHFCYTGQCNYLSYFDRFLFKNIKLDCYFIKVINKFYSF